MIVKRGENAVLAGHMQVVEQQAHAHAAVGGADDVGEQRLAGQVAIVDVILQVQRALRARVSARRATSASGPFASG